MLEPGIVWLEFQTTIEKVIALLEYLIVKVLIYFLVGKAIPSPTLKTSHFYAMILFQY